MTDSSKFRVLPRLLPFGAALVVLVTACERAPTAASEGGAPATAAAAPAPEALPTSAPAEVASAAATPPASAPSTPPAEASSEAESVDGPPPLRLDPPVLDFGIIPPGKVADGTVKLINTGNRELEVLTVQPGCKCTTINEIAGQKIPVGGFVELKTAMTAQSSPGTKRAEIKILIDGYTEVVKLSLVNEVSLPIRVSPSYLNAVEGQPQNGRIVVESIDKKPFKICSIGGKKPNLVGFDPEKDEPRNQYLVEWDFARDFPDGTAPRYWVIETDREDSPLVDLFVRHRSTLPRPSLRLTDYRHTFGRLAEGESHEFVVDIGDLPETERVITAASTSSVARIDLLGSEREGSVTHVRLKVTPSAGTLGVQYIPFTIYTNSKQQATAVFGQWVSKGTVGCFGR
ncbi:MAG: DUF1573 domain-containing protein [bacterium]